MRTLNSHTGYLEIDHRDSPGIRPEDVAHVPNAPVVGAGARLERDVKHCTHCQRAVLLNPGRVRDRAICPKCHHYICDECDAVRLATGGACVPFELILDRAQAIAEKFLGQPDHPDARVDPISLGYAPAPSVAVPSIVLTDQS